MSSDSATPSRAASPSPPLEIRPTKQRSALAASDPAPQAREGAVGRMDPSFYRKLMPAWRCRVRELLVESLDNEVSELVALQTSWRTRFRDHYFVKTSLLGTHTFFMIFIPIWAWYGFPEVARGLLYVLAAGGYVTSVLKDAFCVPRPFSPPVHRLSVGSHALEYGFPSTHSSNALSMALFFGELLLRRNSDGHWIVNSVGVLALVAFAWSITFGRLYTGMHSRMDVRVGSAIGVLVWLVTWLGEARLESVVLGTRLNGTLVIIPSLLLLVTFHPQPAENCPCFEDAIAFLSVFAGILLGVAWNPYKYADHTLGYARRDVTEIGVWSTAVGAKLVIGVSSILVWRIVAKYACHKALPPLFRLFAPVFALPRRYYVAATEYGSYPEQTSLNPVPSILDLPSLAEDAHLSTPSRGASSSSSSSAAAAAAAGASKAAVALRNRPTSRSSSTDSAATREGEDDTDENPSPRPSTTLVENDGSASLPHARGAMSNPLARAEEARAGSAGVGTLDAVVPVHLDADVLTKVVVYAGIGWTATVTLPWAFGGLGLSVWKHYASHPGATAAHVSKWAGTSLLPDAKLWP